MAEQRGTLETIATALAGLLKPLEERLASGEIRQLLAELGLQFPASLDADASLKTTVGAAVQNLEALPAVVAALEQAIAAEDYGAITKNALKLTDTVRTVIEAVAAIADAIKAAGGAIPAAELNAFASELPQRLLEYLVVRNLEGIPGVTEALEFVGALDRTELPAVDAQHPAYVRRRFDFTGITNFVTKPAETLATKYDWGVSTFDGSRLFPVLERLMRRLGVPVVLDTTGPLPVLDVLAFELKAKRDVSPPGLTLSIAHPLAIDDALPFGRDDWQVKLGMAMAVDLDAEISLTPTDGVIFVPPTAQEVQGEVSVEFTLGMGTRPPYVLLGQAGGSRLEVKQFIARAVAGLKWNPGTGQADGSFALSGDVKGGKVIISFAGADGFLGKLLSGVNIDSDFDMGMGYSTKTGVYFTGSATLEVQLPTHIAFGPVEITALTLTVGIKGDTFPIGVAASLKAALGPLTAVVEQIGLKADVSLPPDHKGNAGPVNVALGFLPPKGVGLSVNAGPVSGGGYLFFDFDKEEYAGALQLRILNFTLTCIGLITTKMPDGSKGFSLLIIITVEFGTGIQLGYGFVLVGVGGLLGLNRTVKLTPLADGVRTGAIAGIMFPKDVVANAPRIISDLRVIFPPYEGKFLIGPMAKIGWGSPALITLSLGIIIEIPGNVAIVGLLQLVLPDKSSPILILQVAFVGAIEFDKKRLWLFAGIFDSKVLTFTLEGEMGVLMAFGEDANFVLSVGGFHPRFKPPPLPFPSPKRMAITILNESAARIRADTYFAVTTNTVQIGAHAELYFGFGSTLTLEGSFSFDALFQFSPFYFLVELSLSASLKVLGQGIFSVGAELALEGPTPWHARGRASIQILFWTVSADFDRTWGDELEVILDPVLALQVLADELAKAPSWIALPPATGNLNVSLRVVDPSKEFVLHPVGTLRVTQRAIPLNSTIDRVGAVKPSDATRFTVQLRSAGLAVAGPVKELFAPAQYHAMTRDQKLARPAFEPEDGGLELASSGDALRSSLVVRRVVRYEQVTIDTNYNRLVQRFEAYLGTLFSHFLSGNAAAKSQLSAKAKKQLQPFADGIAARNERFGVATRSDNRIATGTVLFDSEQDAREYLDGALANDPALAGTLHVLPEFELSQAA
jgi:hypothetical protein